MGLVWLVKMRGDAGEMWMQELDVVDLGGCFVEFSVHEWMGLPKERKCLYSCVYDRNCVQFTIGCMLQCIFHVFSI